ncbi:hypothetical protein ASE55_14650 [Chryseobacterium sp. Leaf201]|nr:hypothetical protein ASE55_14650 [Chryseobacterium sp. Leaf201]
MRTAPSGRGSYFMFSEFTGFFLQYQGYYLLFQELSVNGYKKSGKTAHQKYLIILNIYASATFFPRFTYAFRFQASRASATDYSQFFTY